SKRLVKFHLSGPFGPCVSPSLFTLTDNSSDHQKDDELPDWPYLKDYKVIIPTITPHGNWLMDFPPEDAWIRFARDRDSSPILRDHVPVKEPNIPVTDHDAFDIDAGGADIGSPGNGRRWPVRATIDEYFVAASQAMAGNMPRIEKWEVL